MYTSLYYPRRSAPGRGDILVADLLILFKLFPLFCISIRPFPSKVSRLLDL